MNIRHLAIPILLAVCFISCQEPASTDEHHTTVTGPANPTIDTLLTDQRLSYRLPANANPTKEIKLFIRTEQIPIDLVLDGRIYFKTPSLPVSGAPRLYCGDELLDFDVKQIKVGPRFGEYRDLDPHLNCDSAFPGESIALWVSKMREDQHISGIFLGGERIPVAYDTTLYEGAGGHVARFIVPESAKSATIAVKIDSAVFALDPVTIVPHSGKFLDGKSIYSITVDGSSIWCDAILHINLDSVQLPQAAVAMRFWSKSFAKSVTWRGDSLLLSFSDTSAGEIESYDFRLLTDPHRNEISGTLHFSSIIPQGTTELDLTLDRMTWTKKGRVTTFGSKGGIMKPMVSDLKYSWKRPTDWEDMSNYLGFGDLTITFTETKD